jgi:hypothetical protein
MPLHEIHHKVLDPVVSVSKRLRPNPDPYKFYIESSPVCNTVALKQKI